MIRCIIQKRSPFWFDYDFSSLACGENANCQARNNRAQCECPPDFLGDPNSRCYTECTRHDECSATQVFFCFSKKRITENNS